MMNVKQFGWVLCGVAMLGLAMWTGCSKGDKSGGTAAKGPPVNPPSAAGAKFILASEPAGAKGVEEVREKAADKEDVVIVGRIGGSSKPFVDGLVAFEIMDLAGVPCNERPGDACETPWDYCCEPADELAANSATVQVMGADGALIKSGLSGVNGLKPLAVVTVAGIVSEAADGNVIVRAEGIHIA